MADLSHFILPGNSVKIGGGGEWFKSFDLHKIVCHRNFSVREAFNLQIDVSQASIIEDYLLKLVFSNFIEELNYRINLRQAVFAG